MNTVRQPFNRLHLPFKLAHSDDSNSRTISNIHLINQVLAAVVAYLSVWLMTNLTELLIGASLGIEGLINAHQTIFGLNIGKWTMGNTYLIFNSSIIILLLLVLGLSARFKSVAFRGRSARLLAFWFLFVWQSWLIGTLCADAVLLKGIAYVVHFSQVPKYAFYAGVPFLLIILFLRSIHTIKYFFSTSINYMVSDVDKRRSYVLSSAIIPVLILNLLALAIFYPLHYRNAGLIITMDVTVLIMWLMASNNSFKQPSVRKFKSYTISKPLLIMATILVTILIGLKIRPISSVRLVKLIHPTHSTSILN